MNVFNISRKLESTSNLKTTIPLAFKMVFSNPVYIAIAAAIFTTLWIVFSVFDQLLFFSPVVTFYLPIDAIAGFILKHNFSINGDIGCHECICNLKFKVKVRQIIFLRLYSRYFY
jgi:hypothetical protein